MDSLPCGSAGKESDCSEGDLGSIPGLGRSPGEGKGYPLQYSGLENSMNCKSLWGRKESDTTERLSLSSSLVWGMYLFCSMSLLITGRNSFLFNICHGNRGGLRDTGLMVIKRSQVYTRK